MKPRNPQFLPRTLMVCLAPLLACATAQAEVVFTNESNTNGVWTLPAGTNLLTGRAPVVTAATHEASSSSWDTVVDGTLGDAGGNATTSVTPNNGESVTFALDLTSKPEGHNITSFDSYCTWGNSGRDNQNYMLQYSTVANPSNFITISTVDLRTSNDRSTHTRLTDTSGFLATGVHSIKIIFDRQENGYVGYREFVLKDDSSVVCVDNRNRNDNANWSPLVGPNLLNGATATPAPAQPVHGGDTASSSWATVTDGVLGTTDAAGNIQSVTPNNGNTVTFPLDLAAKPAGYDITSFESYAAWGSNGRDDQRFTLEYSVVGAPTVFLPLTEVFNHTEYPPTDSPKKATRTRVTRSGGTPLALGVAAIRLTFHDQENGYCGYREFILRDTPPVITVVKESNNTNIWTFPTGTNLLANTLPKDPAFAAGSNHGATDNTNPDWAVLTDGSVGSAGNQLESVGPNNDTYVVFPLDISTNSKGYNLTSIDTYAAWANSGRDDQNYKVSYSTAEDPTVWIPIQTISNQTLPPVNATHTRIASTAGNVLGTHVGALRFDFAGQENSWVGFREFIALGSPVPLFTPLTWSGATNSTWDLTADNWKEGTASAPYNVLAPLSFDSSSNASNRNINIPSAINAAGMTFTNGVAAPYTFAGQTLTVANNISLEGAGNATFNNPVVAGGISISGTGSLTLGTNNDLTTSILVSNGSLNVASDSGVGTASVAVSGGIANFRSGQPVVASLSGTGGSVILGNSTSGTDTELYIGSSTSTSYEGAITDASATANGGLFKVGMGTLTLGGANTYTGITTVSEGALTFGKRNSLYNGDTTKWTGSNIIVSTLLTLRVGGTGEFTSADVAAIGTSGFAEEATLGLDSTSGNAVISNVIASSAPLSKLGVNSLSLSGTNTFTKGITVTQGTLVGANPDAPSFPSDVTVGNGTYDTFVNMAFDNQFGPDAVLRFNVGSGAINGKVQLRGTNQTVAGLESATTNRLGMIQNDEVGSPGYTEDPGSAWLTIDTDEDHVFNGFIRNQAGGSISVTKTGAGTQEFSNALIPTNFSYNGLTIIEEGTLRLNFRNANSGFSSPVTIEEGATFNLRGLEVNGGGFNFAPVIDGPGKLLVDGINAVRLTNNANTLTGGITVGSEVLESYYGFLALVGNGGAGAGDGEGQYCAAGAMIPSNVLTVNGGATLALDGIAPLGNSTMLAEFGPSIRINQGSLLSGGSGTVAFVPNLTLDGAEVRITGGGTAGDFNTNLAFVGTVVVPAGSSTRASRIFTDPAFLIGGATPSDNANVSLGSAASPGTVFDVADVTGNGDADLTVSSSLKDIRPLGVATASPLTKSGPGTMAITGDNSYTGDTRVLGGVLTVNGGSIPDSNKLVIDGGKLGLAGDETVGTLYYAGVQQIAGTYGSTASTAAFKDDTRFSGTGVLTVSNNPVTDPYLIWDDVIPNAADRDRGDDPDGDGFTNLQEYLFGTSPVASTGSLSTMEKSGTNLILRWCQRAPGNYVVQESETLAADSWSTSLVTPSNASDQGGLYSSDYVRKEVVIPISGSKKFIRVKATE
ncbi:autotransporter-associated beta strand repeat-containing protein [Luteolibacter yonseiensis]|uniref:Autotransporter-associated beta strand repeat-containing protein n=1 Tax=Luteolibacter yonseiensis TaxID=1144680 RepID=A0A934VAY3_9BACT|nr:autotransporter-associated beta strand repeat-containing protein [Luteolibacter yonseiensis]MBK1816683.1 autotransporter-associated beta strand repeat-containing protein [Luteolibacter yonseiensis]